MSVFYKILFFSKMIKILALDILNYGDNNNIIVELPNPILILYILYGTEKSLLRILNIILFKYQYFKSTSSLF